MRKRSFRRVGKRRVLTCASRRNRIRLPIPPRRALRKSVESRSCLGKWTRDVCNRGAEHQKLCAFTFGQELRKPNPAMKTNKLVLFVTVLLASSAFYTVAAQAWKPIKGVSPRSLVADLYKQ